MSGARLTEIQQLTYGALRSQLSFWQNLFRWLVTRKMWSLRAVATTSVQIIIDYPSSGFFCRAQASSRALAERGRQLALNRLRRQQSQRGRITRRLVLKSGDCNVTPRNITMRHRKYIFDLFTTLVDMRWRWHLLAFVAVFIVTWSAFAGLWLAISTARVTIRDDVGQENGNESSSSLHTVSCVENVNDFMTALMFSIETQATIGYRIVCIVLMTVTRIASRQWLAMSL